MPYNGWSINYENKPLSMKPDKEHPVMLSFQTEHYQELELTCLFFRQHYAPLLQNLASVIKYMKKRLHSSIRSSISHKRTQYGHSPWDVLAG